MVDSIRILDDTLVQFLQVRFSGNRYVIICEGSEICTLQSAN
jgi:hypothetical protein